MECTKWIGIVVAAACLLTGVGSAVAQAPEAPVAPPLGATLEGCQSSPLPAQRVASFVGSMPAMADLGKMQMRFELQRRRPVERMWRPLHGVQGFDVWETAMPGHAGFVFHKRVDGLRVPASYRALVRFRWYDADGALARRARRHTSVCGQPDLRPDLAQGALRAVLDAGPALALYTLVVRNEGGAPAGSFAVRVAGGVSEVAALAAGEQVEVVVLGHACMPGSNVLAIVDADRRIAEADEDNGLRRRCPIGR
ncbi:MAG TPA: CARDB domain-containing protein [Solirubrobacteraceae bacterium]|jgi:hypothetical protein|nr:CARDB domain-containing protein [Solirubrobacteraceae bacterium]